MKLNLAVPPFQALAFLNRFIERRHAMLPTFVSFPNVDFVVTTIVVMFAAFFVKAIINFKSHQIVGAII
jgi:hypothetical protein